MDNATNVNVIKSNCDLSVEVHLTMLAGVPANRGSIT